MVKTLTAHLSTQMVPKTLSAHLHDQNPNCPP